MQVRNLELKLTTSPMMILAWTSQPSTTTPLKSQLQNATNASGVLPLIPETFGEILDLEAEWFKSLDRMSRYTSPVALRPKFQTFARIVPFRPPKVQGHESTAQLEQGPWTENTVGERCSQKN